MTQRLTPADWLNAGLAALADGGPAGLRADRLARTLKVSRGSFYWHFAGLADFEGRLADHWRNLTTEATIQRLETVGDPRARLRLLIEAAFDAPPDLERGMRAWAAADDGAARAVSAVDARRLAYLQRLLQDAGLDPATAEARAQLLYLANLGRVAAGPDAYGQVTPDVLMTLALSPP